MADERGIQHRFHCVLPSYIEVHSNAVEATMKTFATIALAALFLNAGAFAKHPAPAGFQNANVTVIAKNQSWPAKLHPTFASCKERRCIDI
jgi:hypothetical protein